MANVAVMNAEGKKLRDFAFEEGFLPEAPNTHLMHLHVIRQMRHARAGTASTLTRAEVAGGGKKPWKQKGTGRARAGSIRSPLWKGGGVIFGPKPRKYTMSLSVKARRLAIRSAILAQLESLTLVDGLTLAKPSTKQLNQTLVKNLGATGKVLLIVKEADQNLILSARNLPHVTVTTATQLSVRDIVKADRVIATEDALRQIQEVFQA